MTLAKALGNGLPIGAMLATEKVAGAFSAGAHASTFGGTPIVTAVALRVLQLLEEDNLLSRASEMGDYLRSQLEDLQTRHPVIESVRGQGLLLGVQLSEPGALVVAACMERGYLINCIQDNVLRLAPPLIIRRSEIDGLIQCLDDVLPI
jgi:acetylornithine aminotransferase